MKKTNPIDDDEMPAEFDFSKSIANPWFVTVHGAKYVRVIDANPLDHEIDFSKNRPNPFWLGCVDRKCVRLLDRDLATAPKRSKKKKAHS